MDSNKIWRNWNKWEVWPSRYFPSEQVFQVNGLMDPDHIWAATEIIANEARKNFPEARMVSNVRITELSTIEFTRIDYILEELSKPGDILFVLYMPSIPKDVRDYLFKIILSAEGCILSTNRIRSGGFTYHVERENPLVITLTLGSDAPSFMDLKRTKRVKWVMKWKGIHPSKPRLLPYRASPCDYDLKEVYARMSWQSCKRQALRAYLEQIHGSAEKCPLIYERGEVKE